MALSNALKRIGTARHGACNQWPYAATAILSLSPMESRTMTPTAAVDARWRLYVNPDSIDKWDDRMLQFIILHEVSHLLLRHHARASKVFGSTATRKRLELWNMAADIAIHSMMKADNLWVPDEALTCQKYGLDDGLSVEEYYSKLLEKATKENPNCLDDDGQGGCMSDETNKGGSCADGQRRDWEASLDDKPLGKKSGDDATPDPNTGNSGGQGVGDSGDGDADQSGDGQGDGDSDFIDTADSPDGIDEHDAEIIREKVAQAAKNGRGAYGGSRLARIADHQQEPRVSPERLLRMAMANGLQRSEFGSGTSTYRRPARRPSIGGALRPNTIKPNPTVCILVDTSGSMGSDDLGLAMGMIAKCLRSLNVRDGIRIMTGDTCYATDERVTKLSQVKMVGGGGTDMGRIIKGIDDDKKNRPDLILCLTDGITPWPEKKTKCTTVACLTRPSSHDYYPIPSWMKSVVLKRN